MSTRCNILIKQQHLQVCLYHHMDGYPEGVGMELAGIFKKNFTAKEEKGRLLWFEDVVNDLIKNHKGYEYCAALHGDIEYLYTIDLDRKKIVCEEVNNWHSDIIIKKTINMMKFYKEAKQEATV